MFCIQYKTAGHPARYFNPGKELQNTIKTAYLLPETYRRDFENASKTNPTMHIIDVNVSPIVEIMYPHGVQKNKIKW